MKEQRYHNDNERCNDTACCPLEDNVIVTLDLSQEPVADDPLANVPSPFTVNDAQLVTDSVEAKRRSHIWTFVMIATNENETRAERENAIRHMLVCDPTRAVIQLTHLASMMRTPPSA